MKTTVMIAGKRISRLRASWLLLAESWRYLKADTELLVVPFLAILAILVGSAGVVVLAFILFGAALLSEGGAPGAWLVVGLMYLLVAFVLAYAQAVVSVTVAARARRQNMTLSQSLAAVALRMPALFVWSVIAATVGFLLRAVSERSALLGRLVAALLGAAWNILTLFVVPVIVLESEKAPAAMRRSASVFRHTWGETLVTNVSLSFAFACLQVVALLAFVGGVVVGVQAAWPLVLLVVGISYALWLVLSLALQYVLAAIVTTLLYLYATNHDATIDFNPELLGQLLVPALIPAPASVNHETNHAQ